MVKVPDCYNLAGSQCLLAWGGSDSNSIAAPRLGRVLHTVRLVGCSGDN